MTGSQLPPFAALRLLSMEGKEAEASALIAATIEQATAQGQGLAVRVAQWAAAVLYNGIGHYDEAAAAAREVTANDIDPYPQMWALPELVEAAARIGENDVARNALDRLAEMTRPAGTDWGLGTEARSRALLSDGENADLLYREAIERFGRTRLRPELARAHLLYGEWLRREGRRSDAREQLRTAHHMFAAMGMEAFAERTRRELVATGETVRKRSAETRDELTPQEEQIARLARDGLSNPEIGAQLFLSSRTVEWHLRKVYAKLGISSRRELWAASARSAAPSRAERRLPQKRRRKACGSRRRVQPPIWVQSPPLASFDGSGRVGDWKTVGLGPGRGPRSLTRDPGADQDPRGRDRRRGPPSWQTANVPYQGVSSCT